MGAPGLSHPKTVLLCCLQSCWWSRVGTRRERGILFQCHFLRCQGLCLLSVCDCRELREHGTTPRHPAASRGGKCVGTSTAALGSCCHPGWALWDGSPWQKSVLGAPPEGMRPSQIHGVMAMQGLQQRSGWAGGSVALLGKCWATKGRFRCPVKPGMCQGGSGVCVKCLMPTGVHSQLLPRAWPENLSFSCALC